MNLPVSELFFAASFATGLFVLRFGRLRALKAMRQKSCLFWMLFAFVASGYEHSVANMTFLSLALLLPHPDAISAAGLFHNLIPVTLGNIVGEECL